jgi:hypothetical protein
VISLDDPTIEGQVHRRPQGVFDFEHDGSPLPGCARTLRFNGGAMQSLLAQLGESFCPARRQKSNSLKTLEAALPGLHSQKFAHETLASIGLNRIHEIGSAKILRCGIALLKCRTVDWHWAVVSRLIHQT